MVSNTYFSFGSPWRIKKDCDRTGVISTEIQLEVATQSPWHHWPWRIYPQSLLQQSNIILSLSLLLNSGNIYYSENVVASTQGKLYKHNVAPRIVCFFKGSFNPHLLDVETHDTCPSMMNTPRQVSWIQLLSYETPMHANQNIPNPKCYLCTSSWS